MIAEAQMAAEGVNNGLKFLKGQLQDGFNYRATKTGLHQSYIILNPGSPAESYVTVAADGTLKSGYGTESYSAFKKEDVAKVMADITTNAMLEAARKVHRKPGVF